MSARTRAEIKTLVQAHHGRGTEKSDLEDSLCNTALKIALQHHAFQDAQSSPADITITEDASSVDISGTSDIVSIVTARIVEADGSRNRILTLKTRSWWDKHVRNAEDNLKGWPIFGMQWGSTILIDRPADSGLELRLRVTTVQSFASDATVCPIAELDIFVEKFVTAGVFASLENWQSAKEWKDDALGVQYKINGKIGGELANAVSVDSVGDTALDLQSEGSSDALAFGSDLFSPLGGVSVTNDIAAHDDYGNTRWWV